jgi:hypothetical protein
MAEIFTFPPIPSLMIENPFLGVGGGGGSWPGGGLNTWPGFQLPPVTIGGGGSPGTTDPPKTTPVVSGSTIANAASLVACLLSPGTCLLRLVFLILGLICIAGAIYLFKPTQQIIAAPLNAAKTAALAA